MAAATVTCPECGHKFPSPSGVAVVHCPICETAIPVPPSAAPGPPAPNNSFAFLLGWSLALLVLVGGGFFAWQHLSHPENQQAHHVNQLPTRPAPNEAPPISVPDKLTLPPTTPVKPATTPNRDVPPTRGLRWKWTAGQTLYQQRITDSTYVSKSQGQTITTQSRAVMDFTWTPLKQEGQDWVIEQKIIGYQEAIDVNGRKRTGSRDVRAAIIGSTFQLTVTPDMKVTRIEGYKEYLEKVLATFPPAYRPMAERTFNENSVREVVDPLCLTAPNRQVKAGDTWACAQTVDLGPNGTWKAACTYRVEVKAKDLVEIALTPEFQFVSFDRAGLKDVKLKVNRASGTMMFDPHAGRVEAARLKLEMSGSFTVEGDASATPSEMTATVTELYRSGDEPLPPVP